MRRGKYLGIFRTTGYNFVPGQCPNDKGVTFSGRNGVLGLSCAIDPAVFGHKVLQDGDYLYVEGIGPVRIDDTGSAIRGKHLDIACGDVRIADIINGHRRVWMIGKLEVN